MKLYEIVLIILSAMALIMCCVMMSGCSWQGQKYPVCLVSEDDKVYVAYDEWWSMRFAWMSGGIECYTRTDNYLTGSKIDRSMSDANAIEAIGGAAGEFVGKAVK